MSVGFLTKYLNPRMCSSQVSCVSWERRRFLRANLGVIVPIFDGTDGGFTQTKSQPKRGFSAVKMDGRWKGQWLLFFGVANLVRDIEMAMRWFSTKQIGPATSTHELF